MAIPGILSLQQLDTVDPSNITADAAIDGANSTLILKDPPSSTIPGGGTLTIELLMVRAIAAATDEFLVKDLGNALGVSQPIYKEVLITDESLTEISECATRAQAELAKRNVQIVSCQFETRIPGWEAHQVFIFNDSLSGTSATLTVQSVETTLEVSTGTSDIFSYSVQASVVLQENIASVIQRTLSHSLRPSKAALVKI